MRQLSATKLSPGHKSVELFIKPAFFVEQLWHKR